MHGFSTWFNASVFVKCLGKLLSSFLLKEVQYLLLLRKSNGRKMDLYPKSARSSITYVYILLKKSLIIHIYIYIYTCYSIHTYMSTVLPSRTFLGRDSGLSLVWHHASWKTHGWNDPWPIHIRVMSHFSRWIPHLDHPGCLISFDGRLPAQTNSLQRGQMWQECHVSSIRGKPWIWKIPRNSETPMFTADSVLRCLEHRKEQKQQPLNTFENAVLGWRLYKQDVCE